MNIWTQIGAKIKFTQPDGGFPADERLVNKHLVVGEIYTISDIKVHKYHTKVYLEEVPDVAFNSCHFDNVTPVNEAIAAENEQKWNASQGIDKIHFWEYN